MVVSPRATDAPEPVDSAYRQAIPGARTVEMFGTTDATISVSPDPSFRSPYSKGPSGCRRARCCFRVAHRDEDAFVDGRIIAT